MISSADLSSGQMPQSPLVCSDFFNDILPKNEGMGTLLNK